MELITMVVVWLAVATLNQIGIKVDLPQPEPKAERVIRRESVTTEESASRNDPCPEAVPVKPKTAAAAV